MSARQQARKPFFFLKEKEAKRTFVRSGSETPIPGGAHPPTFGVSERGVWASPVAASPRQSGEVFFASFFFRKKKCLLSFAKAA
jgi:hypothetical protein